MVTCYDETLRNRMTMNNGSGRVVLNRNFDDWDNHVIHNLENRFGRNERYHTALDEKLLGKCREHAREYSHTSSANQTIALTHPFYLSLTNMNCIKGDDARNDAKIYLDNLFNLLSAKRDKSKTRIIAFETIHHYAASTSLLVENGLIDEVVFTLYDSGEPLEIQELEKFTDNDLFWGGGYNERCLSASVSDMNFYVSKNKMWGINGLCVNSPEDNRPIMSDIVFGIDPDAMISLDELAQRVGLVLGKRD